MILFRNIFGYEIWWDLELKIFENILKRKNIKLSGHWKIILMMIATSSVFIFEFPREELLPECCKLEFVAKVGFGFEIKRNNWYIKGFWM